MQKYFLMLSAVSLSFMPTSTDAQSFGATTGSRVSYPAGQSYIISSSPTADGGVITTTYQPPQVVQSSTLPIPSSGRPIQNAVIQYRPATYPAAQTQFQSGSPLSPATSPVTQPAMQPATMQPAGPQALNGGFQPTTPPTTLPATSATAGMTPIQAQAPQGNPAINPYVGFPLPSTSNGRIVAYSAAGNACATVPANAPPTLQGIPTNPTVPVTQNYRPLVPVQGVPGGSYVSQGLWGNPRAYVQGQPIRNFWRYVIF